LQLTKGIERFLERTLGAASSTLKMTHITVAYTEGNCSRPVEENTASLSLRGELPRCTAARCKKTESSITPTPRIRKKKRRMRDPEAVNHQLGAYPAPIYKSIRSLEIPQKYSKVESNIARGAKEKVGH